MIPTPPPTEPWPLVASWYADAVASEPDVPDAVQIATVDGEGRPTVRTVLAKSLDAQGLVFYTNLGSRKARHLEEDSRIAAVFHWKSLQRQLNLEGRVTAVSEEEADAYWATRPRGSQLAARASRQSEPLDARDTLLAAVAAQEARYEGRAVPRPEGWSGFRLLPQRIEFWQGMPNRLHERLVYTKQGKTWTPGWLQP